MRLPPSLQTKSNSSLLDAIKRDNVQDMVAAIENGANVNAAWPDVSGRSAGLHTTVRRDNLEATRLLLRCGADPNIQTRRGCTPLYEAAAHLKTDAINMMLDWGGDPEIPVYSGTTDISGERALHMAVKRSRSLGESRAIAAVEALVLGGADPLAYDPKGRKSVMECIPNSSHQLRAWLEEVITLPRVTVDERLSKEDLLNPDPQNGLSPLDNPVTWRQWPAITQTLAEKGEYFTKDELLAKNALGIPRAQYAVNARMLAEVVKDLNTRGESLAFQELQKLNITENAMAGTPHIIRQLSDPQNIVQQGPSRFRQALNSLKPDERQDIPNFNSLVVTTRQLEASLQGISR